MTKKQCKELKEVLTQFVYDENRNQRPQVVNALALVEIELLRRIRQSKDGKENWLESKDHYPY